MRITRKKALDYFRGAKKYMKSKEPNKYQPVGLCHAFDAVTNNSLITLELIKKYFTKYKNFYFYGRFCPYWFNPRDRKTRIKILNIEIKNLNKQLRQEKKRNEQRQNNKVR